MNLLFRYMCTEKGLSKSSAFGLDEENKRKKTRNDVTHNLVHFIEAKHLHFH